MVKTAIVLALAAVLAGGAEAQRRGSTMGDARDVATQPGRDVGLTKSSIPPVLAAAAEDPYTRDGARTCPQIGAGVRALNEELGPDFDSDDQRKTSLLKRGGAAVVNSFVPFRGIVREVSGAASADRELAAATQAGIARRGFLRGLHSARGCRTAL